MEKKRSLVLIFGIISCLLVGTGIFSLIFLNIKTTPPQEIEIDESYHKISFIAREEDAGYGYTFRIRNDHVDICIKSDIPVLEANQELLEKGIKLGEIYKISYCLNKGDIKDPVYSNEVDWTASQFLENTNLTLVGNELCWDSVENVDYYTISYFILGENYTYNTQNTYCSLSKLRGGEYNISVECNSNKSYYKTSAPSNSIENVAVIHEIPSFDDIKLERFSKRLRITSKEEVKKVEVFVEDATTSYSFTNLTTTKNDDSTYMIYCDISSIYDGGESIGVQPGTDSYNVYNGEIFWVS